MSDTQASDRVIAEGAEYALLTRDDGASFILRSKAENTAACLQDDNAARFRADYDAIQKQYPDWNPDQTLAQLWDQGGYSWLATQEER